ncbi:DUF445 domain-containing protein [Alkaliphilus oremlandii]|uniref:Putative membrane protin n=1 Tax=Alkaliphilus oremlandii (strain OhILAs) TaxID=350688 RepID=A8MI87_ALKOO|nr:DUF445 family protein [Alkaliphilus oremlandii]ABW19519.1 putative membrane protin [Alkaliphilus oremlandii OhILAs]
MWALQLMILAAIGGVIGWVTNYLAIKMLFRPFEPVAIPIINFQFQGLIPKRKTEIAKSIGETIEKELLSVDEIMNKLITSSNKGEIIALLKGKITEIVSEKLPSIIPSTFKGMISKYVNDVIDKEGEQIIDDLIETSIKKASSSIEISKMVEDKVNEFDMAQMEGIIIRIAQKELKHIEVLGGILGFMIGIFQGIITLFF